MKTIPYFSYMKIWQLLTLLLLIFINSSTKTQALAGQTNLEPYETAHSSLEKDENLVFLPLIYRETAPEEPELGEYTLQAFSDALRLPTVSELEPELVSLKIVYCLTDGLPDPNPQSYLQALQNAQLYIENLVGTATMSDLQNELASLSTGEISTFVMAAVTAGETDAALAALLIAVDKFPNEPMMYVNAAGLLSSSGLPNEALAFLDAAEALDVPYGAPMGVDGKQIAKNNRAHAHLMLAQWAEADAILQDVVVAEPQLTEAQLNLSRALLCQNKHTDAAYWYRLGLRRRLWDVTKDGPEIQDQMIPIEELYDLSAGMIYQLPEIPTPDKPEQALGFNPVYQQMSEEYFARILAHNEEFTLLFQAYNNRELPFLEQSRLDSIHDAWAFVPYQTDLVVMEDEIGNLDYGLFVIEDDHILALNELFASGLSGEPLYQACRSLLTTQFHERMTKYYELEEAIHDYVVPLYASYTGVLANAHDPLIHDLLMNATESAMDSFYYGLSARMAGWNSIFAASWSACNGFQEVNDEIPETLNPPAPDQCPDFIKGIKVGVALSDFLTVSITCEIIDVEISGIKGISPFVQYTHDLRKNEVTAFFGAKVKVGIGPVLELNAKEGFYVRANQTGLTDVGMKIASGGAIYAGGTGISGQIDGPEMEAGVAAAVEYWLGPK